jgi:hypothetical protein
MGFNWALKGLNNKGSFPNIVSFMRYVGKAAAARQAKDDNMAHAHCMLGN